MNQTTNSFSSTSAYHSIIENNKSENFSLTTQNSCNHSLNYPTNKNIQQQQTIPVKDNEVDYCENTPYSSSDLDYYTNLRKNKNHNSHYNPNKEWRCNCSQEDNGFNFQNITHNVVKCLNNKIIDGERKDIEQFIVVYHDNLKFLIQYLKRSLNNIQGSSEIQKNIARGCRNKL